MEGGMTYGRNTLVRSVNTTMPDDVTVRTVQQLISESYAGVRLEENMRFFRSELRKLLKQTKAKNDDVRECLQLFNGALKQYKEDAANMSVAGGREITVLPRSEIKAEQATADAEPPKKEKILQELVELADGLKGFGDIIFYGVGHQVEEAEIQNMERLGLVITALGRYLLHRIDELEAA